MFLVHISPGESEFEESLAKANTYEAIWEEEGAEHQHQQQSVAAAAAA